MNRYMGDGRFVRIDLKRVRCKVCGWVGGVNGLARESHRKACSKKNGNRPLPRNHPNRRDP